MSDFQKGIVFVLLAIAGCTFSFAVGVNTTKGVVASDCADYGAVKLNGKLYECKLK
ncbi:hypothetical protein SAMN05216428_102349 [Nitrosospira sp. Nsp11]|uniref:hypothetical protein n=1 Tax=Nitrosospira sp. Nsp11 TaxID=1855338 RepID=UPI00091211CC|nr:hypothetical protein [Nitrosospira sp. Nsp11]SHL42048.1 hypothetical protein SAMN05216428_102349 [Nitrosospira sp. Nsp11]